MAGMRTVRLGVQLFATRRGRSTAGEVLNGLIAQARQAEAAGFETVWVAEHHDTDWNLCSDPLTLLAALAKATTHVRLGAAVINLGLHHPVRVAEQAALVNAISGGRLELGLGKGFAPGDYRKYGLQSDLDVDQQFRFKHDALCEQLRSDPATATVPMWLASSGNLGTISMALDRGHGLLLAAAGTKLAEITSHLARQATRPRVGLMRAVHCGPDAATATHELRPYLEWYIEALGRLQPGSTPPATSEVLDTFCVVGNAADCAVELERLRRRHCLDQMICVPGIGGMGQVRVESVLRELGAAARDRDGQRRALPVAADPRR